MIEKKQHYLQGYADCINDLEIMITQNHNISLIEMLNTYILALYNLKLNLQIMQQYFKEKNITDKVISILKQNGFIAIKGGKFE